MEQTRKCSKCGEEKLWSKFQLYKGKPSGQCRECKTAAMKEKRKRDGIPERATSRIEGQRKLCMMCEDMKPLEDFSPSKKGLGGVATYCKQCHAGKYRDKERAKVATSRYREVNRERHLASHRIRMFEYRTRKKVTDDGTVTDEFLKALYATEICHYCGQCTEKEERTADHKIALAEDGHHSASNLVMACWSCNSSKRNLSDEEFLKKRFDK
jgi:5-methylcytosine-specific restriction endonuclease McrA